MRFGSSIVDREWSCAYNGGHMDVSREDLIKEFHEAFTCAMNVEPTVEVLALRRTLIREEVDELMSAMDTAMAHLAQGAPVPQAVWENMLKELADVQVVLSGTAVALKPLYHLDQAFKRVHASNMSKLGPDGKPILRADGKVLKGPNYFEPDLSDLV